MLTCIVLKCAQMDEDGDFVRNIVDDESDKSHVDASHDDSSSKVSFETYIHYILK